MWTVYEERVGIDGVPWSVCATIRKHRLSIVKKRNLFSGGWEGQGTSRYGCLLRAALCLQDGTLLLYLSGGEECFVLTWQKVEGQVNGMLCEASFIKDFNPIHKEETLLA